jgi:hypothetical protein
VDLTFIPKEKRYEAIARTKKNMLLELYESYPSNTYKYIHFQELNDDKDYLFEQIVRRYQRADGMWVYNGDFVTLENLINIVREDFKTFIMTAEI